MFLNINRYLSLLNQKGGKMTKNKKGLSDIVVTLIIIVLSLVAIGVVWTVVNNLLKGQTSSAEITSKCLGVNLEVTKVICGTANPKICNLSISRTGTGTDAIAGVKIVFQETNGTRTSAVISKVGDVPALVGGSYTLLASTLTTPKRVEVTPYFTDASGKEQLCSQTATQNW
jgi:hypothetical protein